MAQEGCPTQVLQGVSEGDGPSAQGDFLPGTQSPSQSQSQQPARRSQTSDPARTCNSDLVPLVSADCTSHVTAAPLLCFVDHPIPLALQTSSHTHTSRAKFMSHAHTYSLLYFSTVRNVRAIVCSYSYVV